MHESGSKVVLGNVVGVVLGKDVKGKGLGGIDGRLEGRVVGK
jgi:hypothetical protein